MPGEQASDPLLAYRVGKAVDFHRRRLSLNYSALARESGLTRQGVTAACEGLYVPTLPVLYKLARGLGVEVADLIPPDWPMAGRPPEHLRRRGKR